MVHLKYNDISFSHHYTGIFRQARISSLVTLVMFGTQTITRGLLLNYSVDCREFKKKSQFGVWFIKRSHCKKNVGPKSAN